MPAAMMANQALVDLRKPIAEEKKAKAAWPAALCGAFMPAAIMVNQALVDLRKPFRGEEGEGGLARGALRGIYAGSDDGEPGAGRFEETNRGGEKGGGAERKRRLRRKSR
jgi:hypothetical protein